MKRALLLASLIVLGTGAGTATAGPIQWSYSAEVEYSRDYGNDFLLQWTNQTGTVTSEAGEYVDRSLFTTTTYPGPPRGTDASGLITYNFAVRLTLKDTASGESAVLGYSGWYASQWDKKGTGEDENGNPTWVWDWVSESSEFGKPSSWDWVTLGGNVYTLRGEGGGMGTSPNGTLVLSVSPTATPEPTTLAIAGIGLGALGIARRVRGRILA